MKKEERRIDWIDLAKAIGIIFVYIGHCNIPGVNLYVYMFHMPLFFVISGFCWNIQRNGSMDFKSFLKKKFDGYIVPYFKICAICLMVIIIPHNLKTLGLNDGFWDSLLKYLFGITIYSRGTVEWLPMCSPVWFLTCLFCAEILLYFIMKTKYNLILVVMSGVLGYIMSLFGKIFPWNIDSALSAIPLLYVGIVMKKYWEHLSTPKYLLFLIPICIIILAFFPLRVDFDGNDYESFIRLYLESVILVLTILSLIRLLDIILKRIKMAVNPIMKLWQTCGGGCPRGGGYLLGRNTLLLMGYNYAIIAVVGKMPISNLQHNFKQAFFTIVLGFLLVCIINICPSIKKF